MHKHLQRISTRSMSHHAWLEQRRSGIGGSDVSSILGLNPYCSPYTVWADKLGLLPEKEDCEAMRQGRDFEDYVAKRFCEVSEKKVRRNHQMLRDPIHSFMLANIDREVVGEQTGLECKTTSVLNLKKFKGGDFPSQYYCQCVHYMYVTGYTRWYLAVLILNAGFMVYQMTTIQNDAVPSWCAGSVHVDTDEMEALVQAESDFWALVESETPPPLDGTRSTTQTLQATYADCTDDHIDLSARGSLLQIYYAQKSIKEAASTQMEQIKQTLMQALGKNSTGICGKFKVTWKPQIRQTFDVKSFANDHPDLALDDYYKQTAFRKFDIREGAQDVK